MFGEKKQPSRTKTRQASPRQTNIGQRRPSSAPTGAKDARKPSPAGGTSAPRRPSAAKPAGSSSARPTREGNTAARSSASAARSRTEAPAKRPARPSAASTKRSGTAGATAAAGQTRRREASKRKKSGIQPGRVVVLIALVILALVVLPFDKLIGGDDRQPSGGLQAVATPLISDEDKAGFDASINSDSAILINAGNGDILYEKNADIQRAPASLVKMMTVHVAIKYNDDLDKKVRMPREAFDGLAEAQASQSGIYIGEEITIRDLLYATLLSSGGDAANALAIITSGEKKQFVDLMNEEAKALGLDSTYFVNPSGLDDPAQLSTCRDMARLVKGALGSTTFKEVFTTMAYTTTANSTHGVGINLKHTMARDMKSFERYFTTSGYKIVGGKTGYTEEAGNCLASMAQKEGYPDYIVVTMHAKGDGDQYYEAFHDAVTLYGEAYTKLDVS